MLRCAFLTLLVPALTATGPTAAQDQAPVRTDPSDAFFSKGEIPRLHLELGPEEVERLRIAPRTYVRGTVRENERTVYESVAIKLKGAAGSFREIDDRPAFTVSADKFKDGQRVHGLRKFHLNNSVQDDTWMHELICSEMFAAARIPAPRVTHARVWLNGRDLGLYVLKEGFDTLFLSRHFDRTDGNLYDGGLCVDVDADMEKDSGAGPDDRSDLRILVEACREPDLAVRQTRVGEMLDVEAFVTFMAMELMAAHWDGYTRNRNNYRVYFEPASKKAHFLPHGMDQMFQDPDAPVLDPPASIVAEAVMAVPEWRARFRRRLQELLPLFAAREKLWPKVERIEDRLRPVLKAMDPNVARDHGGRIRDLKHRLQAREKSLREQVRRPDPKALEFDPAGVARLTGWNPAPGDGEAALEETQHAGKRVFEIRCAQGSTCTASWRRKVALARGRYSLRAKAKVQGVEPLADEKGTGAGLRISGASRGEGLAGTTGWKPLSFEFEVAEALSQVELVAELRAIKGQAWFEVESFRLVRLEG